MPKRTTTRDADADEELTNTLAACGLPVGGTALAKVAAGDEWHALSLDSLLDNHATVARDEAKGLGRFVHVPADQRERAAARAEFFDAVRELVREVRS